MWFLLVDWSGFAIPCKSRASSPIANLSTYLPHRGEHLGLVGNLYSKKPEGSSEARRMENRVGMDRGNGG